MEYMRKRLAAALAVAAVLTATAAWAVPPGFNVQARLTDANGVNREGNYAIQFTIYDAPTGGAALWTKTFASLPVRNGNFQTILGDTVGQPALTGVFSSGDSRHLEIQVLSGPGVPSPESALIPRQQLVSVPFALKAAAAENASSLTSTAAASVRIVDGTQANGKVFTSDAAGVGSWKTMLVPTRHYASVNFGTTGSVNFAVTASAFNPPLAAGTTIVSAIEVYAVQGAASTPGGGASVFGFDQGPGSPFHGTNPAKGVYLNVQINDAISVSGSANNAAGGSGSATFLFVAIQ